MAIKIGIPRALMYYQYYPLWKTFFEELGGDVVLSGKTNKDILNLGAENTINEACLPVKVFHGHVIDLKDRVDYLFIPRLLSVSKKEYICPKIGGLPDMVKFSIKNLPPIIDSEVNFKKSKNFKNAFLDAGSYITSDRKKILSAAERAFEFYEDYKKIMEEGHFPSEILEGEKKEKCSRDNLKIAVMGHIYNLYDKFSNIDIFKKLSRMNISVTTPEELDRNLIENCAKTVDKKIFWTLGKRQMGSAIHYMKEKTVDGIIYIMSFGCGVDSFITDLIEKRIRRESGMPFLLMMIDEQTGEAGVNTRLEAFVDMIKWRKNNADNVPAYR